MDRFLTQLKIRDKGREEQLKEDAYEENKTASLTRQLEEQREVSRKLHQAYGSYYMLGLMLIAGRLG
jgi:hypothetical protein